MDYPFPPSGPERPANWTPEQIIALACRPGYMSPDDWRPITWAAVVMGESSGDQLVRGRTIWAPGNPIHLSHAIGMFQLLRRWHVEDEAYPGWEPMTEAECLEPFAAFERAWMLLNVNRTGWAYNMSHWSAFEKGTYDQHITACYRGMLSYREVMGLGRGPF